MSRPQSQPGSPRTRARPRSARGSLSRASAGDPIDFLSAFEGEARGFWGRGNHWVAWGGVVERIEVSGGRSSSGPGSGGGGTRSRFDEVRRAAAGALSRRAASLSGTGAGSLPWESPRLFGGFAFDGTTSRGPEWRGFGSATFVLPEAVLASRDGHDRFHQWHDADEVASEEPEPADPAGELDGGGAPRDDDDARERWDRGVRRALAAIREGSLRKVVLARTKTARPSRPVAPLDVLRSLRSGNEQAHVFLFEPRPGHAFVGAAPEILARLQDGRFEATAVAGSAPRGGDPAADAEHTRALLASAKDLAEHRHTLEEMVEALEGRLEGMAFERSPTVLRLAVIQHLETVIRGRVSPGRDILSLVEALHPTPAVCGRPRAEALAFIRSEEAFDRGWYSGPVGWFDARGNGDFVPALRAALGGGREWRLFAGAGIVEGSDPAAEWAETELKLEPALRALRAGDPRE